MSHDLGSDVVGGVGACRGATYHFYQTSLDMICDMSGGRACLVRRYNRHLPYTTSKENTNTSLQINIRYESNSSQTCALLKHGFLLDETMSTKRA